MDASRTSGDGMEHEELSATMGDAINTSMKFFSGMRTSPLPSNAIVQVDFRSSNITADACKRNLLSVGSITSAIAEKKSTTVNLHSFQNIKNRKLPPVTPKGKLVVLKPRLISTESDQPKVKIPRTLKFIPYEPYPGAVNPLKSFDERFFHVKKLRKIKNKNNMDINVLVTHMTTLKMFELHDYTSQHEIQDSVKELPHTNNLEELQQIRNELIEIKKERNNLHTELHFQTQVNSELKNLLVAAVGEDLLARVNVLTEDKLQLTRKLLDTDNNLSTHAEQIEFLTGQCEVWRSKFLASSVMIEELARWKADLSQKNQILTESIKRLLMTVHEMRTMQFDILKNLKFLAKLRYLNVPNTDAISLSAENLNILQQMVLRSGVGIPDGNFILSTTSATNTQCDAEIYARRALEKTTQPLMSTDAALEALFNQIHKNNYLPSE